MANASVSNSKYHAVADGRTAAEKRHAAGEAFGTEAVAPSSPGAATGGSRVANASRTASVSADAAVSGDDGEDDHVDDEEERQESCGSEPGRSTRTSKAKPAAQAKGKEKSAKPKLLSRKPAAAKDVTSSKQAPPAKALPAEACRKYFLHDIASCVLSISVAICGPSNANKVAFGGIPACCYSLRIAWRRYDAVYHQQSKYA